VLAAKGRKARAGKYQFNNILLGLSYTRLPAGATSNRVVGATARKSMGAGRPSLKQFATVDPKGTNEVNEVDADITAAATGIPQVT
jgi:hypothetical protein